MIRRVVLTAGAVLLLGASIVSAQHVVTGTVTPQTVFLVNNQPTNFATIAPGTPVVVQHGQPVMLRDGRYVVMNQPVAVGSPFEVSGVVRYSDSVRGIIRLDDGRNIAVDENVQVLANGSPVILSTVRPGTFVTIRSSKPLTFRDGTYYPAASVPTGTVVATPAPNVHSGMVVRIDQPNTIVLNDGRVIPATAQTVVMVDNRPVPLTALRPGSHVVIYPNGQAALVGDHPYALVSPEAGLREKEMERNAP